MTVRVEVTPDPPPEDGEAPPVEEVFEPLDEEPETPEEGDEPLPGLLDEGDEPLEPPPEAPAPLELLVFP